MHCSLNALGPGQVGSWDWYYASRRALATLAEHAAATLCQRTPGPSVSLHVTPCLGSCMKLPGRQGWAFWDRVVDGPMALKLGELQDAARTLGVKVRAVGVAQRAL
jgi:hypothetical protein